MDSAEVFDCTSNAWTLLPPLLQRRCSCSCAVLRNQLYVIGGVCGPIALVSFIIIAIVLLTFLSLLFLSLVIVISFCSAS